MGCNNADEVAELPYVENNRILRTLNDNAVGRWFLQNIPYRDRRSPRHGIDVLLCDMSFLYYSIGF
jgi:hypothetical protein